MWKRGHFCATEGGIDDTDACSGGDRGGVGQRHRHRWSSELCSGAVRCGVIEELKPVAKSVSECLEGSFAH